MGAGYPNGSLIAAAVPLAVTAGPIVLSSRASIGGR
jgi:hypothetical protein